MNTNISERRQIATRVASLVQSKKLCAEAGGTVNRTKDSKDRDVYEIAFAKSKIDGRISIYSDHFLLVRFQSKFKELPKNGNQVFKSEQDLVKFIESIPNE